MAYVENRLEFGRAVIIGFWVNFIGPDGRSDDVRLLERLHLVAFLAVPYAVEDVNGETDCHPDGKSDPRVRVEL